jgi:hypothetical protein
MAWPRAFAGAAQLAPSGAAAIDDLGESPPERWADLHALLGAGPIDTQSALTALAAIFAQIEADLASPLEPGAAMPDKLAGLKGFILGALTPSAAEPSAQKSADAAALEKASAERDAMAKAMERLEPRLAELAERLTRLERAPAPPPHLPGYAPVEKNHSATIDDLAEHIARLPPEQTSLLLIKAAQRRPRQFG